MTYWTDYPITRLGDKNGEIAPVRKCKIVSYDGDKYARVKIGRYVEEIKTGYIYKKKGRVGEVPCILHKEAMRFAKEEK